MKSIIIFGDLPIATELAKFINDEQGVELAAVVIGNETPNNVDPWNSPLLKDFAKLNNIKCITLEDIAKSNSTYDLGISCRFSKIIKKNVIDKFTTGIVNFHGGLLPEFAGLYSVNHTILSGSSIGGATLHWIDEGIDTGNIIERIEIVLTPGETALSLFKKTQIALLDAFKRKFDEVKNGVEGVPVEFLVNENRKKQYFDKNSLDDKRYVDMKLIDPEEAIRKINAFHFPPHPPAYTILLGQKINLIKVG